MATGQRINSGSDDPAGLAIANGLSANIAALNQSIQNANDGVGSLQVADGALSQVTSLLNTAVTIATEAASGTVSSAQRDSLNSEYQQILDEINRIGSSTSLQRNVGLLGHHHLHLPDRRQFEQHDHQLGGRSLDHGSGPDTARTISPEPTAPRAQTALTAIDAAIQTVANDRGTIGASVTAPAGRLGGYDHASAEPDRGGKQHHGGGHSVDHLEPVTQSVLSQTGMAALAQANSQEQSILKLLH